MPVPERSTDELLLEAIAACEQAEARLAAVSEPAIRRAFADMIEQMDAVQQDLHTLRITRLRLRARLSADPDKTPVRPPSIGDLRIRSPRGE